MAKLAVHGEIVGTIEGEALPPWATLPAIYRGELHQQDSQGNNRYQVHDMYIS